MGYDMYAVERTGDEDRDYFRLNIWGMDVARNTMIDLDMVADTAYPAWPTHPEGEWVEWEDAEPGTPWATYYEAAARVRTAHPNGDDGRLPIHKLCSNDGWIITEVECRALVGMANDGRAEGRDLPEWWKEWIDFIDHCSTHGGFEVW